MCEGVQTTTTLIPVANGTAAGATLGERVRAARRERGLSQSQLAGDELTKGFISQVESGQVRPSLRSLQIIAGRLAKPLDYFIGDQPLSAAKRAAFHTLAAQAAAEREAWGEARAAAQAGLAEGPQPRERGKLLRIVAQADTAAGEREAAFERVREGLALVPPSVDAAEHAELLYVRARNYSALGQLAAATESYEAARDVIERHEVTEPRIRARILVALGTMYRRLNRTTKALASYENALTLATRTSEMDLAARGYMGIASSLYDSGELDGAITNYQRALEIFSRVSDTSFELNALQSIAAVQFESGRTDEARAFALRAMARGEAVGDARWSAVAEVVLARVALAEARTREALASATHAETVLADAGDQLQRADALRVMGAAHEKLGHTDEAEARYRESMAVLEKIGDRADLSAVAAEFAQVLRAHGKLEEAFQMLDGSRGASTKH